MNDQGEQIKKNFLDQWIRLAFVVLYIIVFGLLWRFIAILLLVVIILQSLHRVIAAENNSTLLTFSEGLGNFLLKVLNYVLYLSDDKPIDFDAFFSSKNDKAESSKAQASEESAAQTEDTVVESAVEEPAIEAEAAIESEPEAAGQENAPADDVFADISFTEQTEDSADDAEDEDEQSKKPG